MKRNMDLIRRIAMASEALENGQALRALPDVPADVFSTHVLWMNQAGLVQARVYTDAKDAVTSATVTRLTWDGCEFMAAARDDTLWRKAMQTVLMPTASFTFGVLKDWLTQEISQGLPPIGR